MTHVILLTGSTGFLGAQIARRILSDTDSSIVALVRANSLEAAMRQLRREWWQWPTLYGEIGGRVRVIVGDVRKPHLGLTDEDYSYLAERVTHVIHTAADLRLDGPIEEMRQTNVVGTGNILELARAANGHHGMARLIHVSTAYVAGGREGIIEENKLSNEHGFYNGYELTKYEGEKLVREAGDEFPISIVRPGMIVGDSETGQIRTFNTIYYPLRLYLKGRLRLLPTKASARINIVPVDYVADSIVKLTLMREGAGLTLHLTSTYESLPTVAELIHEAHKWAKGNLGVDLPRMFFLPLPSPKPAPGDDLEGAHEAGEGLVGKLGELRPYFSSDQRFDRANTDLLLGKYVFDWRGSFAHLLSYAVYHGLLHPNPLTVHEQILTRLESRSMPVSINDIVDGRVIPRDSKEVRREMLSAAGALHSMGVARGDRVAIVGLNSSRYLTLDVAIGLVGAVSVPLYYTSPPSEIREIVSSSGAKLLLVGSPEVLKHLDETGMDLPVISFCINESAADPSKHVSWADFLAKGKDHVEGEGSPVDYSDLATVRYTSGTTGPAKGVCFSHGNLRWMGEAVCSITPWRIRSTDITYLSFLPMNHVVEGIIGAYSPFYAPAPLNLYFLEHFQDLQKALPLVRPTVFFSVPRFYEKVWEVLQRSGVGRRYVNSKGVIRSLLRPIIRRTILSRAGLDRCGQLIVGSAPVSEALLRGYEELGVDIHDAYGLTEAPLVTMNLPGRNRVGTVGEPLPETQVKIEEDGEILVKGPQVTLGYLDPKATPPFREGYLSTGDLGRLEDGYLVVNGRKKELIKTSYGKYVQPAKIEAMLREIRDVEEAMIVGEGCPYCVALIWIKKGIDRAKVLASMDQAISEVNKRLSHPEQVKRWATLENDLSISRGDLTANLKLKRSAITMRFGDVIEGLYSGHSESPESKTVGDAD
ncbi:MAG: AMP-binding protein [Candidatus Bathyarchaeota archaeon]|nr:AMP-binding protein [Candidatus Bathyarchaeota archaeon]